MAKSLDGVRVQGQILALGPRKVPGKPSEAPKCGCSEQHLGHEAGSQTPYADVQRAQDPGPGCGKGFVTGGVTGGVTG